TSAPDVINALVNTILSEEFSYAFVAQLNGLRWTGAGAQVTIAGEWIRDGDKLLEGSAFTADELPLWSALRVPEMIIVEDANQPNTDPLLERLNVDPAIGLTIDAPAFVVIPLRVANRQLGAIWISCD